ncbi:MAG: HAMP domain-containing histidine kinase [Flavobacteriales bacterium]|nr:Adaptive-response sensory-kinase SasA [Flavobacteriales bacterium]MCC6578350.1 HAMP domain-containing histidine kinase [Flavobacteriales bacterium]NUQ14574.1 HAMP domain-containing histidine kinase [Flavobacteriales bacterium]
MFPQGHRRTLLLFGVLAVYIVLQSLWWAYLLVRKDQEMQALIEAFQLATDGGAGRADRTFRMVVGEGSVFLALLIAALVLTYRAIRRDLQLARAQRNFLLAVTHELRTPIAGAKLNMQTLQRHDLEAGLRDQLAARAVADLDRLAALTDKVLLAARAEETDLPLEMGMMDLVAGVRHAVDQARSTILAGHQVTLEAPPSLTVKAEALALRSVVDNLLENAGKYTPPGSRVLVAVRRKGEGAVLEVADEGPGVPESEKERIFQRLHRGGDEAVRATQGTGLGLYIARRLMRRMGGTLTVRNAPQGGAIFAASFPTAS